MTIPDKQQALIDLATKFVGVHEVGYNDGPQIEVFQSAISKPQHQPWCVDFVQYCVKEIDGRFSTKSVLEPTESALLLWEKTPISARRTTPEPGCIMLWQHYDVNGQALFQGHAGIVREVLGGNYVTTCEANTSPGPGIQREGDGVYLKRRMYPVSIGSMRTLGFLMPWAN